MSKRLLVTGSSGLIGGEVDECFYIRGWSVTEVNNNIRTGFSIFQRHHKWNQRCSVESSSQFWHQELDISRREEAPSLGRLIKPDDIRGRLRYE